jgi:hypothetical protein
MSEALLQLLPFEASDTLAGLSLEAHTSFSPGRLAIRYVLQGPLELLKLPGSSGSPQRRDGLWQTTCLEAFLALPGQPGYWEVNLAPDGDWNLYRLTDYRQGLEPEPSTQQLPVQVERRGDRLSLSVVLDLRPLVAEAEELDLAITAVIAESAGPLHYWALSHRGTEPDFHRRDSFMAIGHGKVPGEPPP